MVWYGLFSACFFYLLNFAYLRKKMVSNPAINEGFFLLCALVCSIELSWISMKMARGKKENTAATETVASTAIIAVGFSKSIQCMFVSAIDYVKTQ